MSEYTTGPRAWPPLALSPPTEPDGLDLALSVLEQQRELLSEVRAAIEAAAANNEYVIYLIKENKNHEQ